MTTLRSALRCLGVVVAAVTAAGIFALVSDRGLGASAPLVPMAAAATVAAVFAWRATDGLLAFVMFALFADTIEHWLRLDLLLFDELGLILLVAVSVGRRYVDLRRIRFGWHEASLAVLVGAGIASSVLNGVPAVTWIGGLSLLLKGVAFFYLMRWMPVSPGEALTAGTVILVVAGAVGGLGLLEWLDPTAFQRALGLPSYGGLRGDVPVLRSVFLHPALFGWLTAYASLLCYARFLSYRSWWAFPAALVLNVGTFFSGRRTPLIGVIAAVGVGAVLESVRLGWRRAATRIWLPAGAVLVLLVALAGPSIVRLAAITAFEYGPSMQAATEIFADEPRPDIVADVHPRVALYAGSMAIARDRFPLGGGVGRFGSHLSRSDYSPLYEEYGLQRVALLEPASAQAATDAFWPMILGETGVLGLLGGMTFFFGIGLKLARGVVGANSLEVRLVGSAALFVFIEALVRSATSSVFVAPPIAYFAMGAAGLALSALAAPRSAPAEPG